MNVLITGASSGIGRVLAEKLCERSYFVVGVGRKREALEELRNRLSGFDYVVADLVKRESLDLIEEKVRRIKVLNWLVNNAGFGVGKPLLQHGEEELEEVVLVNMVRPLQLIIRLIRYMPGGSVVVNVITSGVHLMLRNLPSYGAAKMGLYYASRILREELRDRGIHLVDVFPGATGTEFFQRAGVDTPSFTVSPDRVAEDIIKAVEKKRKSVYTPFFLKALSVFGPLPFKV